MDFLPAGSPALRRGMRLTAWAITAAMALVVFFIHLGDLPLRMWDESRVAVNALEIHRPSDALVLTYEGSPDMWNTKPPLLAVLMHFSYSVFGIGEFAVRLPSALAAFCCCILFLWFAQARLRDPLAGIIGVLVLITTNGFVAYHVARHGDFDALLSFGVLAMTLSFHGMLTNEKSPNRWTLLFAASLTAALFAKGIAGALALPVFLLWAVFQSRQRRPAILIRLILGAAIPVGMLLAFYALREWRNPGFLQEVYRNELGFRFLEAAEGHRQSFFFYLRGYFQEWYKPWTWLLLLSMPFAFRQEPGVRRAYLLLVAVAAGVLLVLSVAATKLPWYAAPTFPLVALATGIGLSAAVRTAWGMLKTPAVRLAGLAVAAGAMLLYVVLLYRPMIAKTLGVTTETTYPELFYGSLMKRYYASGIPGKHTILVNAEYNSHLVFYKSMYEHWGHVLTVSPPSGDFESGDVLIVADPEHRKTLSDRYVLEDQYSGYGAIYTVLSPKRLEKTDDRPARDKVAARMDAIRGDPAWFSTIQQKASKNGIPADRQVMLDAVWVLQKDGELSSEEARIFLESQGVEAPD